jgi:hypothetical protein
MEKYKKNLLNLFDYIKRDISDLLVKPIVISFFILIIHLPHRKDFYKIADFAISQIDSNIIIPLLFIVLFLISFLNILIFENKIAYPKFLYKSMYIFVSLTEDIFIIILIPIIFISISDFSMTYFYLSFGFLSMVFMIFNLKIFIKYSIDRINANTLSKYTNKKQQLFLYIYMLIPFLIFAISSFGLRREGVL